MLIKKCRILHNSKDLTLGVYIQGTFVYHDEFIQDQIGTKFFRVLKSELENVYLRCWVDTRINSSNYIYAKPQKPYM